MMTYLLEVNYWGLGEWQQANASSPAPFFHVIISVGIVQPDTFGIDLLQSPLMGRSTRIYVPIL